MSCKRYEKALTEAAAAATSDLSLSDSVREHLDSCPGCREFFAREQTLFAAVDSAAQRTSNAEIPPAVLVAIEAFVRAAPISRRRAVPLWAYAFAAAAFALTIFAAQNWRHGKHAAPDQIAHIATADTNLPALQWPGTTTHLVFSERAHQFQSAVRKHSRRSSDIPKALVQPDEEEQISRFYNAMQTRAYPASAVTAAQIDEPLKPLAMPPIEIARLETKNPFENGDVSR
jgi:hypothetical protein